MRFVPLVVEYLKNGFVRSLDGFVVIKEQYSFLILLKSANTIGDVTDSLYFKFLS